MNTVRWLIVSVLIVGLFSVSTTAHAVPAPVVAEPDDTVGHVELGAIEDIYDVNGNLQSTVRYPTKVLGFEDPVIESDDPAARVIQHDNTGCHRVRGFVTGFSEITGTVLWRYWNRTSSCWSKPKRLVYNVSNHAVFTDYGPLWHPTAQVLKKARYFYNPANSWDPFPLPGLNSHSAYYNWSKGEIEGTCGVITQVACWMRPWVTVKSLYNGNWLVIGSNGTRRSG